MKILQAVSPTSGVLVMCNLLWINLATYKDFMARLNNIELYHVNKKSLTSPCTPRPVRRHLGSRSPAPFWSPGLFLKQLDFKTLPYWAFDSPIRAQYQWGPWVPCCPPGPYGREDRIAHIACQLSTSYLMAGDFIGSMRVSAEGAKRRGPHLTWLSAMAG